MEEELATAGTSKSGDPSTERNEEEDGEEYSSGEEGESGEELSSEEEGDSGDDEDEEDGEEGEVEEDMDENDEEEDDDEDDDEEEEETEDEEAESQPNEAAEAEDDSSDDENCDRCPICLNRLKQQDVGMPESCDHLFCLECIQEWSKNVNTCPVDRQVFHLILAKHPGEDKVYHQFPVEDHQALEVEEDEAEQDDTACEVCGLSDREDRLLLCDSCDAGYHCDCLDPPLASVPVQEWFCPDCVQQRSRAEEEPLQNGRQIARTRVSERVRRIIADARAARAERRRIVAQRIANRESFMDEEPTPGPSTSTPGRRGTKRKRPTRRKTAKKRKTTAKKKTATKRKTAKKGTPGKRTKKKRRRRVKKKSKSLKATTATTTSAAPGLARTAQASASVKGRIADKLGIKPPPVGRSMPVQKAPAATGGYGAARYEAAPSFSILGTRDELYSFAEDEGEERLPVNRPAIPASSLSRSALHSHRPLGLGRAAHARRPITALVDTSRSQVAGTETPSSSGKRSEPKPKQSVPPAAPKPAPSPFDLLGSIMSNQDLLHKGSKDITIQRDGSLTAASSSLEIHAAARRISLTNSPSSSTNVTGSSGLSVGSNAHSSASTSTHPASIATANAGVVASTSDGPSAPLLPPSSNSSVGSISATPHGHLKSVHSDEHGHSLTATSLASNSHSQSLSSHEVKDKNYSKEESNDSAESSTHKVLEKRPVKVSSSGDHLHSGDQRAPSIASNQQEETSDSLRSYTQRLDKGDAASHQPNRGSTEDFHTIAHHDPDHSDQQEDKRQHKSSDRDSRQDAGDESSHRSHSKRSRHAVSSHTNNHINSPLDSMVPFSHDEQPTELEGGQPKNEMNSFTDVESVDIKPTADCVPKEEINSAIGNHSTQCENTYSENQNVSSENMDTSEGCIANHRDMSSTGENVVKTKVCGSAEDNAAHSQEILHTTVVVKNEIEDSSESSLVHSEEKVYETCSVVKREIVESEPFAGKSNEQIQCPLSAQDRETKIYRNFYGEDDRGWNDDNLIYEEAGWGDYDIEQREVSGLEVCEKKDYRNTENTAGHKSNTLVEDSAQQDRETSNDCSGYENSTCKKEQVDQDGTSKENSEYCAEIKTEVAEEEGEKEHVDQDGTSKENPEYCAEIKREVAEEEGENLEGAREEGEASDSGEEGEVRDENDINMNEDYEDGEIVEEDEEHVKEIKKEFDPSDADRYIKMKSSCPSSPPISAMLSQDSAQDKGLEEQGEKAESGDGEIKDKVEEEDDDEDEEEEEESSGEEDFDPNHGFNLGNFLESLRSNEFDRKKEKAAKKEAIRLRKEEKEKRKEAERIAKENAKISIYDFIGSSAKKFGVHVPTSEPKKEETPVNVTNTRGRGRGTKVGPLSGEGETHPSTYNAHRPGRIPWEKGGREHRHSPERQSADPAWRERGRDYPPSSQSLRRDRGARAWNSSGQFNPHSHPTHPHRRRHSRSPSGSRGHLREKRMTRKRTRSPSPSVHREMRREGRRRERRHISEAKEHGEDPFVSDNSGSSDEDIKVEGSRKRPAHHSHKRSKRKWGRYSSEMNGSVSSDEDSDNSGSSDDDEDIKGEPEVDSDEEVLAKRTSPVTVPLTAPPLPPSPAPASPASPASPPSPPAYSPVGPASPASPAEPPPPPPSPPRVRQQQPRPVQKQQVQQYPQQQQHGNQGQPQTQPTHTHPQQYPQHQNAQAYPPQQHTQPYPQQSTQSHPHYPQHYQQHPHYGQQQVAHSQHYSHAYSQHPQYSQRPGQPNQYPTHPSTGAGQYPYSHPHPAYPRAQTPAAANQRAAAPAQGAVPAGHPSYHYYSSHSTASAPASGHPQPTTTSYQQGATRPAYQPYPYQYPHSGYNMARHPYQPATSVSTTAASGSAHPYPYSQPSTAYQAASRAPTATAAPVRAPYPYSAYGAHTAQQPAAASAQPGAMTRPTQDVSGRSMGRLSSPPSEVARTTRVSSYRISPSEPSFKGVATSDRIASNLLLDEVKKGFRQLVEDAVRSALKPAWNAKKVTKDEYKDIFKRAVDKVCGSKETVVQQDKIQFLVEAYVAKARKTRTSQA